MNAAEERAELLRNRAAEWRAGGLIGERVFREILARFVHPWRTHRLLVQAVFLLLTAVAATALFGFMKVIDVPRTGLVAGVLFIVLAEVLIGRYRWFATGVESALWLAAMISFITELPDTGSRETALVLAVGIGIAAFRVRNPFFGLLAGAMLVVYGERFDAGVVVAIVLGLASSVALLRTWSRPSAELFWSGMAIVMPFAGRFAANPRWIEVTIVLYAVYGTVTFLLGVRRRHHALLVAAAVGWGIAAVDQARRMPFPAEAKLAAEGILLLGVSWAVSRVLRDRTTGLVVRPVKLTSVDDGLEIAGALAAAETTAPEPPADDNRPAGGGSFGGAGATGDF